MSSSVFYSSSGLLIENKRKQKDRKIHGSCQRAEKAMEHEGDGDTNYILSTCNGTWKLENETLKIWKSEEESRQSKAWYS